MAFNPFDSERKPPENAPLRRAIAKLAGDPTPENRAAVHASLVAGPLLIAHPGQGPVEAIAEPVGCQGGNDGQHPPAAPAACPEGETRPQHEAQDEGAQKAPSHVQ